MILPDWKIRQFVQQKGMISPFIDYHMKQSNNGKINPGLSSAGYDFTLDFAFKRVGDEVGAVDPKEAGQFVAFDRHARFLMGAGAMILGQTVETFDMPDDVLGLVFTRSTLARCFAGDTRVKLVDGTSPTIKEMADEYSMTGKVFYGFGVKDDVYIAQELIAPRKIGREPTLSIILDNGQVIKCTGDHKFCMRNGGSKRADAMRPGDSLMPLYTGLTQGYERVWDPFRRKFLPTARMVDDMLVRKGLRNERPHGTVIHHADENKRNNVPENLARMNAAEHSNLHNKEKDLVQMSKTYWATTPNKKEHLSKLHSKEAVAKSAAGRRAYYATDAGKLTSIESRRKMWITRGAEGRRKQAEVIRYLRFRDDITEQAVAMALLEAGTVRGAARLLKVDRSAFRRFPHIIELFKQGSLNNNHKVISISKLSDVEEDVYCLTAPETGNFALDAGVIAHNCGNFLNVTPIEPGWRGQITLEISNIGSDPVWIYPGEGIGQIIFMWIDGCPERTYADKQGKYQNQHGVTGPIVQMGVG